MNEKMIPDVDSPINPHAVSIYNDGAVEDFPVLKAFQQYIDAEQAKARKRLITLGIFFSVLMFVVIGIFVAMLMNASARNQELNDRLVEFVMKERDRQVAAPVVVQQPQQADNAAIIELTAKFEKMQKAMADAQQKELESEKARAAAAEAALAAAKAAVPKAPSKEELEINRLKALLEAEKEKASIEAEKHRQEELEAYRRKYYPELYAPQVPVKKVVRKVRQPVIEEDEEMDDVDELLNALDDDKAINYFDKKKKTTTKDNDADDNVDDNDSSADNESESNTEVNTETKDKGEYSVPVEKPSRKWHLPKE